MKNAEAAISNQSRGVKCLRTGGGGATDLGGGGCTFAGEGASTPLHAMTFSNRS